MHIIKVVIENESNFVICCSLTLGCGNNMQLLDNDGISQGILFINIY